MQQRVDKKDLRRMRDWWQFSTEVYGIDWMSPDDETFEEFVEYLDERTDITPISDFEASLDDTEFSIYKQDLALLNPLYFEYFD